MTDKSDWQGKVGDNWASEWQRTDRSFGALNDKLVATAATLAPDASNILDIGCGAGATSLALSAALPNAQTLGIDLSQALVRTASKRAAGKPNCTFAVGDASIWSNPLSAPDLLVSRHGVMFFDDPIAAFANLATHAEPGAQLLFSCFRARAENDWATKIAGILPTPLPEPGVGPGPFAFADEDRVHPILATSGWQDAKAESFDFSYVAGGGDNPIEDAIDFFSHIGPAAPIIRALEGDARAMCLERLKAVLQAQLSGDAVRFEAAAWIWTAKRGSL